MKILIFSPFDEFNSFFRFNVFLYQLKKRIECHITAALPYKAISVVSEADDYLTVEDSFFDSKGANYPQVLDIMTDRNITDFREFCYSKIDKEEYDDILVYGVFKITTLDGRDFTKYGIDIWFNEPDLGKTYFLRDIHWFRQWLSSPGKSLKPTTANFEKMESKYNVRESFILITRNFLNKQPTTNTHISIPNLKEMVEYLCENEIAITNIGFPPSPLSINNPNYLEINDKLSQEDLMSLFYLSRGLLLTGENAGYIVHSASEADIFLIKEEWGSMGLLKSRKFFSENIVDLVNRKKYDIILEILSKHKKKTQRNFADEKKIIILKENN